MITGVHMMIASTDAEADRAFLRDVLELPNVDDGGGWLIFRLPPAELGVHPADHSPETELYLICDDLSEATAKLAAKGVDCGEVRPRTGGGRSACPCRAAAR